MKDTPPAPPPLTAPSPTPLRALPRPPSPSLAPRRPLRLSPSRPQLSALTCRGRVLFLGSRTLPMALGGSSIMNPSSSLAVSAFLEPPGDGHWVASGLGRGEAAKLQAQPDSVLEGGPSHWGTYAHSVPVQPCRGFLHLQPGPPSTPDSSVPGEHQRTI